MLKIVKQTIFLFSYLNTIKHIIVSGRSSKFHNNSKFLKSKLKSWFNLHKTIK